MAPSTPFPPPITQPVEGGRHLVNRGVNVPTANIWKKGKMQIFISHLTFIFAVHLGVWEGSAKGT